MSVATQPGSKATTQDCGCDSPDHPTHARELAVSEVSRRWLGRGSPSSRAASAVAMLRAALEERYARSVAAMLPNARRVCAASEQEPRPELTLSTLNAPARLSAGRQAESTRIGPTVLVASTACARVLILNGP